MLEKTTSVVARQGVIGRVCAVLSPPPTPPSSPLIPRPPVFKPAAPVVNSPINLRVYKYQDSNGDCWRVSQWIGLTPTIFLPTAGAFEKQPISCSEL